MQLFQLSGTDRPIGLGYKPPWAEPYYDPTTDIPSDAVYLSVQGGLDAAWTAALATSSKTLVIDQDVAVASTSLGKANIALLGAPVEGRLPKMTLAIPSVAGTTRCLVYGVDGVVKARGIEFVGFGDVFGIAVASQNNYPYHEHSLSALQRFIPNGVLLSGMDGAGVALAYGGPGTVPSALGIELSTTFDICDCVFTDCQGVACAISDGGHLAPVKFQRNRLVGTWGGIHCFTVVNCDLYAYGNEWTGCTGVREIADFKNNHYHTCIMIGTEGGSALKTTRTHTILIENNAFHDITDRFDNTDVNTAVGVDIRNANPTMTGWNYGTDRGYSVRYTAQSSVRVAYNSFKNLVGTVGQEDCNAIYLKALGFVVEHNRIENCGAKDPRATQTATRDGSETTAVLAKNPGDWLPTAAEMRQYANIVRHNEIIDPPTHVAAPDPAMKNEGLFVIKIDGDENRGGCAPTFIVGNHIVRWRFTLSGGNSGALRTYNQFPNGLYIEDNDFFDCPIAGSGMIVRVHQGTANSVGAIKDNRAFDGPSVTYGANRKLITNTSACVVSGNRLVGAAQPDATATFSAETATPSAGTARLPSRPLPSTSTATPVTIDGQAVFLSKGSFQ
jgi:hypothetical protein